VWITSGQMTMNMNFTPPKGYTVSPTLIQQFLATSLAVIGRATELDPSQQPDAGPQGGIGALCCQNAATKNMRLFQPCSCGRFDYYHF